jgi:hypothetical protein
VVLAAMELLVASAAQASPTLAAAAVVVYFRQQWLLVVQVGAVLVDKPILMQGLQLPILAVVVVDKVLVLVLELLGLQAL